MSVVDEPRLGSPGDQRRRGQSVEVVCMHDRRPQVPPRPSQPNRRAQKAQQPEQTACFPHQRSLRTRLGGSRPSRRQGIGKDPDHVYPIERCRCRASKTEPRNVDPRTTSGDRSAPGARIPRELVRSEQQKPRRPHGAHGLRRNASPRIRESGWKQSGFQARASSEHCSLMTVLWLTLSGPASSG